MNLSKKILLFFIILIFVCYAAEQKQDKYGLGFHLGAPVSGYSLKWWSQSGFGLQLIGYEHRINKYTLARSHSGARLLWTIKQPETATENFRLYLALGGGRVMMKENQYNYDYDEIKRPISALEYLFIYMFVDMFNVMFGRGTVVKTDSHNQMYVVDREKYLADVENIVDIREMVELSLGLEGIIQNNYGFNFECGVQSEYLKRLSNGALHQKHYNYGIVSLGLHYFF